MKQPLPDWVLKFKQKGIAIERRGDSYYASRISSVWDPKKKRSQKKTIEYLGKVTPEGIIPPKGSRRPRIGPVLDYGNLALVVALSGDLPEHLSQSFPDDWQSIFAAGALRLCYNEPLDMMQFRFETSFAKRLWPEATLSKGGLGKLMVRIGQQSGAQRDLFARATAGERHMAIDISSAVTDEAVAPWAGLVSRGGGKGMARFGATLLWDRAAERPVFFKLLPGTAASAQTMANAIWESGLQDVVVVMDKGFWSLSNMECLEDAKISYIMVLDPEMQLGGQVPPSHFKKQMAYQDRRLWWHMTEFHDSAIYHYLDRSLAMKEGAKGHPLSDEARPGVVGERSVAGAPGTLSILTNTGYSAEEVFAVYMKRREIESTYCQLIGNLGTDMAWVRSRECLGGYLFLSFIALELHSLIKEQLGRKGMLKRFGVDDVLKHLSKVCTVEIDRRYYLGDVPKSAKRMIELLEVPITEKFEYL